jgi:hypothetical protein
VTALLRSLFSSEAPNNALRFAGFPGHVESYFVRANHPSRPLALWLKATVLAPLTGPAVAEAWFIFFDGEQRTTFAHRQTQPFAEATFSGAGAPALDVKAAGLALTLGSPGAAQGTFTAPHGTASLDLRWHANASPIARPLSIFPWKLLRTGPFPKSKLLTPFPSLRFSGRVVLPAGAVELSDWHGMQGHNWGKEHAFEYAWGQCLFPADDVMVEGFTGRVKVAGRTTPRLSALVVRRGARTFRFDTLFDVWRQQALVGADTWALTLRSGDGEATLAMDASGRPMVCLGYGNPDGQQAYCFNSKLAKVTLTVRPADDASFTCVSDHGGALEFLRREPDPRFPNVV